MLYSCNRSKCIRACLPYISINIRLAVILCFLQLLSGITTTRAQNYTISGFVTDAKSGEKLIGANIYIFNHNKGTVTNNYGFYSITLPSDSIYLGISYIGYEARKYALNLQHDQELSIELIEEAIGLEDVTVLGERPEDRVASTQMSTIDVPLGEIKKLPVLFGETDILKAIQLLPGVQAGSEGSSGLYVRGGGPDQNLILLDGAPVYNASHIFGFFSVFNPDALQNVSLIKGGFPARYGGRLSSVLDISMKEGNLKKFQVDGGIGLISSKLTLQGPIIKDKMSFIVSGRRTYIDLLTRPFIRRQSNGINEDALFYFYDLNAKINYIQGKRSRLYLSVYTGKDEFGATISEEIGSPFSDDENPSYKQSTRAGLDWGNLTSTFRWNYLINNKLFANTSFSFSKYSFNTLAESHQTLGANNSISELNRIVYNSGIQDWTGKIDFDFRPSPNHYIRFGANAIYHRFTPGIGRFRSEVTNTATVDTLFTEATSTFNTTEYYAYIEDDVQITPRLKVNVGSHYSGMTVNGKHYTSLQPRASLSYVILPNLSAKASYGTMQQYLHLLSNSGINLPTDLWVAATDLIKPQTAWQAATGIHYVFPKGQYEASFEGYYKGMKNLIEYKPGASFLDTNQNWQDKVEVGQGWSYGAELFLQKRTGRTTGWIGYTLSWTERKFENLNDSDVFPYKYDRRHDISAVVTHKLKPNLDVGFTWVYGTGNAITLANSHFGEADLTGFTNFHRESLQSYGKRNSYRMASYHRFDFALNWHKSRAFFSKKGESTLSLSVYNAYNRKNPFFIYASIEEDGQTDTIRNQYTQVSLFPVLPSISYTFRF